MQNIVKYYEDLNIGKVIHLGPIKIKKSEIISFAKQFDPQYFHLDEEKAKDSILKGLCASGWHTCSIFMKMLYDSFLINAKSQGSPGVDNIRWLKPVRPDDILSAKGTIIERRSSKSKQSIGLIKTYYEVFNQNNHVVMTLTSIGIFKKKNKKKFSSIH